MRRRWKALVAVGAVALLASPYWNSGCGERPGGVAPEFSSADHLRRASELMAVAFKGAQATGEFAEPQTIDSKALDAATLEYEAAFLKEPTSVQASLGLSACFQHKADILGSPSSEILLQRALAIHQEVVSRLSGRLKRGAMEDIARMKDRLKHKSKAGAFVGPHSGRK